MNRTHTLHAALLMSALLLGSGAVFAHGDNKHADQPLRFEQKDWGIAGQKKATTRTLTVRMSDAMRFIPDQLAVKQGETVRIVIKNEGAMLHEFVLGTKTELEAHAAMMLKFPDMEHDEPYMVHVPPGKTGEIVWRFNRAGEFDFACLIAGHYQAGMVGKIRVSAGSKAR